MAVNFLKTHSDTEEIQHLACGVLKNLIDCDPSTSFFQQKLTSITESKELAVNLGGIDLVLEAMKNHSKSEEMQEQACWALRHFANQNSEFQLLVAEKGGIELILTALNTFSAKIKVQFQTTASLRNLAERSGFFDCEIHLFFNLQKIKGGL